MNSLSFGSFSSMGDLPVKLRAREPGRGSWPPGTSFPARPWDRHDELHAGGSCSVCATSETVPRAAQRQRPPRGRPTAWLAARAPAVGHARPRRPSVRRPVIQRAGGRAQRLVVRRLVLQHELGTPEFGTPRVRRLDLRHRAGAPACPPPSPGVARYRRAVHLQDALGHLCHGSSSGRARSRRYSATRPGTSSGRAGRLHADHPFRSRTHLSGSRGATRPRSTARAGRPGGGHPGRRPRRRPPELRAAAGGGFRWGSRAVSATPA